MCGQTLSSFPQHRRIKDLKFRPNSFCVAFNERGTSKECVCVCADCWRQAHIEDSWHVQVRAMIHVCGPSCWKYNSNGIRICRHHCYHITILEPDTSAASPAEKASEATKRRQAVEQPTVHPRGRYQRQARTNRSNHGHAF